MEKRRSIVFSVFSIVFLFLILLARLFQLQVINGKENLFLADNNRAKRLIIRAPRGLLADRHGETLVQNSPVYIIKNDKGEDEEITREKALELESQNQNVIISTKRKYSDGNNFAHLIGYLGEVSAEELGRGKLDLKGYSGGSLIGRSGVEERHENELKGKDGSELLEINTSGEIVRNIDRILPIPGKRLTLAVDKKLQTVAASQMEGKLGAVIATNPKNGEVVVFYSSPSYDLNIFSDAKRNTELVSLIKDEENRPLLGRVIAGLYQPGSTFKIVTSIAGLEEGKITADTLINDPGVLEVAGFKYANWYFTQYGRTEGTVGLVKAISRSTDTYFYKLGEYIGIENLAKWAKNFGLDQKYSIDLPGEIPGFVGTPEWKQKIRGENWFLGNTYHMAIGQGDLALTPLGVNLMTAVVANGGKICTPRVLRIGAENTPYGAECRDIGIKKDYLDLVKKGMIGACSQGGTGYPFFSFKPEVACKTGTAEVGDDGGTTHAWFTVFAPSDDPMIVLTVLVEHGGEGSSVAAPIAKEILREYFRE